MKHVSKFGVALALSATWLAGAAEKPPKLPVEIQQAVGIAMAAPPEFAANALLRLAAGGRIPDKDARRDLIERAFQLATRAQYPYRRSSIPGSGTDTRSGYLSSALSLNYDALSLEKRAVDLMFGIDTTAARELFARVAHPALEPLSCSSPLVPEISAYYEMLGRVAQESFTAEEQRNEVHAQFVQAQIDQIASHVELAPAAAMIAAVDWTPAQFEVVSAAFLGKLGSLGPDARSFSASVRALDRTIGQLVYRARQHNRHPERIVEAYRTYLVSNLTAARCADGGVLRVSPGTSIEDGLFGEEIRGALAPLTAEERTPKKSDGAVKLEPYWQSAQAKRIFEDCWRLRTGPDGKYFDDATRNSKEWKRQLADFLSGLASWKADDEESEADFFHQKAIVYEALLELTPAGDQEARVVDDYMGFLKSSNLQQQSPVEWYWHAHSTLNRLRNARPAGAQRLIAAFRSSGNPVLVLEDLLEQLAPEPSLFRQ